MCKCVGRKRNLVVNFVKKILLITCWHKTSVPVCGHVFGGVTENKKLLGKDSTAKAQAAMEGTLNDRFGMR